MGYPIATQFMKNKGNKTWGQAYCPLCLKKQTTIHVNCVGQLRSRKRMCKPIKLDIPDPRREELIRIASGF